MDSFGFVWPVRSKAEVYKPSDKSKQEPLGVDQSRKGQQMGEWIAPGDPETKDQGLLNPDPPY